MKKNLYAARSANGFEDTCKVFFDKEEATKAAKEMFAHLTSRERKEETVTVETYLVTAEEDDERSAEQLFNDLLDEESPEAMNAKDSEEIRSIREISAYDAHEIAVHLMDGGWESGDKAQFAAENSREDSQNVLSPEAIDMIFAEIAEIEKTVVNQFGIEINFETAANLMDDEIREQLHAEGIEDRQEFFDRYAVKHLQKFGEEWECDKPNPQI